MLSVCRQFRRASSESHRENLSEVCNLLRELGYPNDRFGFNLGNNILLGTNDSVLRHPELDSSHIYFYFIGVQASKLGTGSP